MTWFHWHRYDDVIDVDHGTRLSTGGLVTQLLKRCRCGKFSTETIPGEWPREHFMPSDGQFSVSLFAPPPAPPTQPRPQLQSRLHREEDDQ